MPPILYLWPVAIEQTVGQTVDAGFQWLDKLLKIIDVHHGGTIPYQ